MTRLRALADELDIANRVRFLGPIYDEQTVAPWFLTAKAFCYPSNIGLSLHHAMGYGLPVITGDNPDVQNPEFEALHDGKNRLLFSDGDTKDLAAKIEQLLNNPELSKKLGAEAHATVTTRYDVPQMVQGFVHAITAVPPPSV